MKKNNTTINSPSYYNRYSVEAVEMARRIWGDEALAQAAEITAFFYRMRAGTKDDNPIEQELAKEEWWLQKRREILDNKPMCETTSNTPDVYAPYGFTKAGYPKVVDVNASYNDWSLSEQENFYHVVSPEGHGCAICTEATIDQFIKEHSYEKVSEEINFLDEKISYFAKINKGEIVSMAESMKRYAEERLNETEYLKRKK